MTVRPHPTAAYVPPIRADIGRPLRLVRNESPGAAERDRQHNFFLIHLRSATTRYGRPYKENAIATHDDALIALDKWLTGIRFDGDYRHVDTPTLNAFLRSYCSSHSQGGANTKQRKLSLFFKWLASEYGCESPYSERLARYAPPRPEDTVKVLPDHVIAGLLRVTTGRSFENVRDHAIIRLFTATGMRRGQMSYLRAEDVDLRDRTVAVIGQKGARDGHRKAFGNKGAEALARWMRVRAEHKLAPSADTGWLWLGTRGRGHLSGDAIMVMLKRRAEEAGFAASDVHPHMFRHTYAHHHLAEGGLESDLMQTMSWSDSAMVRVYGAGLAEQRALDDARRRALGDRY